MTGAQEPRSLARLPKRAVPSGEVQATTNGQGSGDGGGSSSGGSGNLAQAPLAPPPPPRLRSHDSLTGASARPRSRATSAKLGPAQVENGGSGGNSAVAASNA